MKIGEAGGASLGRCMDCGRLRADGEDGLCAHCRLRLELLRSALYAEERYGVTWVVFAALVAVILFLAISGAGSVDRGLLGAWFR